jgi:hypothetical protein
MLVGCATPARKIANDVPPPSRVLVIGASLSDKMGGSTAGVPVIDLIFKDNDSPGERIYDVAKKKITAAGLKPKFDFTKKTLLNTVSSTHYGWIKSNLPTPEVASKGETGKTFDLIFALDLIYKDFKQLKDIENLPTDRRAREKKLQAIHEVKMRVVDILRRFAQNSTLTWIGSPLCGDYVKGNDGNLTPAYPAGEQGKHWLVRVLEGRDPNYVIEQDLLARIRMFDLQQAYDDIKIRRELRVDIAGRTHVFPVKKIVSADDWHPNDYGNRMLANVLMERSLEAVPSWLPYFEFFPLEE